MHRIIQTNSSKHTTVLPRPPNPGPPNPGPTPTTCSTWGKASLGWLKWCFPLFWVYSVLDLFSVWWKSRGKCDLTTTLLLLVWTSSQIQLCCFWEVGMHSVVCVGVFPLRSLWSIVNRSMLRCQQGETSLITQPPAAVLTGHIILQSDCTDYLKNHSHLLQLFFYSFCQSKSHFTHQVNRWHISRKSDRPRNTSIWIIRFKG